MRGSSHEQHRSKASSPRCSGTAPIASGDTKARREREKRVALSPDDGRRRARGKSGRTKQLNLNVTPELHRRLVLASHEQELTMTALLEAAIEAYLKKGSRNA